MSRGWLGSLGTHRKLSSDVQFFWPRNEGRLLRELWVDALVCTARGLGHYCPFVPTLRDTPRTQEWWLVWRELRFQDGFWAASFYVQINSLGAFPPLVPPKVWGKGRKGELAGCPSPGLPYLSDQPSFSPSVFSHWFGTSPSSLPSVCWKKVSSLAGCGPVLERGW